MRCLPRFLVVLVLAIGMLSNAQAGDAYGDSAGCVVLLHGLARSSASMEELQEKLTAAGYQVVNYDYPSRHYSVEELARTHVAAAIAQCSVRLPVNFVTHSLGGILVRFYLSENDLLQLGRVVMLAPPSQGSEVVDKLRDVPGFKLLNGPAGDQLGTDPDSVPNRLPAVDYEVGVIAGSRTINFFLSLLIPGDDDGKVSIERARLDGMQDFLVVPHTHPLIMGSDDVIEQVIYFLQRGEFKRS